MQIQLKPTFIKIEEQTKKIYIDQEDIYRCVYTIIHTKHHHAYHSQTGQQEENKSR